MERYATPYIRPVCNSHRRVSQWGWLGFRARLIGAGLWGSWGFRDSVLDLAIAPIEVEFCLTWAPLAVFPPNPRVIVGSGVRCWSRRPLCFGYNSAVSGLSMGFSRGAPVLVSVAKPKGGAGEIEKLKIKIKEKIGFMGECWAAWSPIWLFHSCVLPTK